MKYYACFLAVTCTLWCSATDAQQLTLDEAYDLAVKNYPLVRQRDLISKSGAYTIENISKGALPQLFVGGYATYQSEVTEFPLKLPNVDIAAIPKDQYKAYAEVTQPLTDLALIRQKKELQEATTMYEKESLEAELYKLKERINELYFGILLADEELKQNEITKKDITNGMDKVSAAIANGTDFQSSLDKLKAELLHAEQRDTEILSIRSAYLDMLAMFLNKPLPASSTLQLPAAVAIVSDINRPEIRAFEANSKVIDMRSQILRTNTRPKFSLFVQGGVGNPALNMLLNEWKGFYYGGLRLNWSVSTLYTYKKDKQLLDVERETIASQKETFIWNTQLELKRESADINRLRQLLKNDEAIVRLRTSIKNAASAQLENGVITVNDYLKEVTNEASARQDVSFHTIQLRLAEYNSKTTSGN